MRSDIEAVPGAVGPFMVALTGIAVNAAIVLIRLYLSVGK